MVVLGPLLGSVKRRLWFTQSSVPAGTRVLISPAIGPENRLSPSPWPSHRPGSRFFSEFVGTNKAEGLYEILVIEVDRRFPEQLVDIKAGAMTITMKWP